MSAMSRLTYFTNEVNYVGFEPETSYVQTKPY